MRIALFHDFLVQMGGAERVTEVLHQTLPGAELHTTMAVPDRLSPYLKTAAPRTTWMQRLPLKTKFFRHYFMLYPFAVEGADMSAYDLVVSSCFGFAKGVRRRKGAVHVCYCHNPMRWVWRTNDYLAKEQLSPLKRKLVNLALRPLKAWEMRAATRPDYFIANSQVVADRLRFAFGVDATVISPPIDTERFQPSTEIEDYFLVLARLAPYKNLDIAIEACNRLNQKLIVIGDGPDRERLVKLAGPTVTFLGRQPDAVVNHYASHCRALIFPGEEDFGIAPLEVNASGRPVIAYRGGGATETIIEGLNGTFFERQDVPSLMKAMERFETMSWDPIAIRHHAEQYDVSVFQEKILNFLAEVLPAAQVTAWEEAQRRMTAVAPGGLASVEPGEPPLAGTDLSSSRPPKSRSMRTMAETLVSKFAIQGINAGTGIITARALMPAGRGQLAAMILWPSILASFTAVGVPSSLIYFFRLSMTGRNDEQRERIVATGLVMSVLTGILATIIGILFIPHWMHQYSPATIRAAQWFMIVTPITAVTLAGKSILEAAGSFASSNLLQLSTPLFTVLPLVVLWAMHRLDPFTAACTYIFAALPSFLYLLYRLKPLVAHLRGDIASAKMLLGYGVRSYGTDLLGTLALQVDQVLVVRFLTPTAMGSYVVMLSLSRMLNLVYNSVTMVLFPKAAGLSADAVLTLTERCARVATIVSAAAAIFVYIFGPFFINLLYGREYGSALSSLRILLIEVTLAGTAYVLAQAFMALGRPGVLTILQAIGLSISIPLMIVLIPRWGIKGAAFALLASTLARLVFLMAAFPIFLKTRMPNLLPQAEDFEMLWSRLPFGRKMKAA